MVITVQGELRVPGDKSISHRALMFAGLSDGTSRITHLLRSADVRSTAGVLRALGVDVPELADDIVVQGRGPASLRAPKSSLDCGNSGTTTRLMAGIVAARPIAASFVGDASLSRRPMHRIARPLEAMGARVELPPHGGLPMRIQGGALHGIDWRSEVASAQVKSAVLLAGQVAGVPVSVTEPVRSRDHTERMLAARGAALRIDGTTVHLDPAPLGAVDTAVPGDPSSAAFFVALAALARSGAIRLRDVGMNPTRTGFFGVLRRMGAQLNIEAQHDEGGEPVADLVVAPGDLRGVTIDPDDVPSMIDELPLIACLAARAEGETIVTGASELRVKESDRIAAVVANLRALGVDADELPDGFRVRGSDTPLRGEVVTHGDHRLAMAFGILGAATGDAIAIDDPDCVDVSYPGFWRDIELVRSR